MSRDHSNQHQVMDIEEVRGEYSLRDRLIKWSAQKKHSHWEDDENDTQSQMSANSSFKGKRKKSSILFEEDIEEESAVKITKKRPRTLPVSTCEMPNDNSKSRVVEPFRPRAYVRINHSSSSFPYKSLSAPTATTPFAAREKDALNRVARSSSSKGTVSSTSTSTSNNIHVRLKAYEDCNVYSSSRPTFTKHSNTKRFSPPSTIANISDSILSRTARKQFAREKWVGPKDSYLSSAPVSRTQRSPDISLDSASHTQSLETDDYTPKENPQYNCYLFWGIIVVVVLVYLNQTYNLHLRTGQ